MKKQNENIVSTLKNVILAYVRIKGTYIFQQQWWLEQY